MSATVPEPPQQPQAATPPQPGKRHPWHWIVPCVLLLLIAVGLAVWALSLQNDLDDERAHSAQVEQQAQATQDDVEAVSDQVDDLSRRSTPPRTSCRSRPTRRPRTRRPRSVTLQSSIDSLSDRAKTARDKLSQAVEDAQGGGEK